MTIGTAMIALNQFAQIATQKDPITVNKMVIVSSMVNGKYSSIFPRSEIVHVSWSGNNGQRRWSCQLVTDHVPQTLCESIKKSSGWIYIEKSHWRFEQASKSNVMDIFR